MTHMNHHFSARGSGATASAKLQTAFDAESDTPELIEAIAEEVPQLREVMASLRVELPLVPHSGVGPIGRTGFYRLPNHYRSVNYILPPTDASDPASSPGVIVFKGTEPLLADFPAYFDWMLDTPFRSSSLPLGLHFPLDMKLPPAAMWIEECVAEQAVSSRIQQLYLARHGRLAHLPVPLFVFRMTPQQNARYEAVIRSRIPEDGIKKIQKKLADGLGVEVYYYPELPVRVADLFVRNIRETFSPALAPEQIESTFENWSKLLAEMLCLDYMPYAPWHHGMGGCVDQGNVCIDGGFNDLLTLVPFDTIPDDVLFRRCIFSSIHMLAESMAAMCAASTGMATVQEPDAGQLASTYATERVREHVLAAEREGHAIDGRLRRFFDTPGVADILHVLRRSHQARVRGAQFVVNANPRAQAIDRATASIAAGA